MCNLILSYPTGMWAIRSAQLLYYKGESKDHETSSQHATWPCFESQIYKRDYNCATSFFLSSFVKTNKVRRSARRGGAWRRMDGVLSGKLLQLAKKPKRLFFRSTAFCPTRDEVDVSSEFSRGSRIVLNASAHRFVLSRAYFETNRFYFVALILCM